MLAYSRSSESHQGFWKMFFLVELVFIFFSDCTRAVGIRSRQVPLPAGLAPISASDAVWDLAQIISYCALFIPAHRRETILLYKSFEIEGMLCINAKWWYHLSLRHKIIWADSSVTSCPKLWTKTLLKSWNKELCWPATPHQGPGMQQRLPFYFFSIGNSLQWSTLTGFCSLIAFWKCTKRVF